MRYTYGYEDYDDRKGDRERSEEEEEGAYQNRPHYTEREWKQLFEEYGFKVDIRKDGIHVSGFIDVMRGTILDRLDTTELDRLEKFTVVFEHIGTWHSSEDGLWGYVYNGDKVALELGVGVDDMVIVSIDSWDVENGMEEMKSIVMDFILEDIDQQLDEGDDEDW
jgi:hypothetical protein